MAPDYSRKESTVEILYTSRESREITITRCNCERLLPGSRCAVSENLTLAVVNTRQISHAPHNSLINRQFAKLCTLLAEEVALALKGRRQPPKEVEETMLKTNKNNVHEGVASIANNGAAARCALGLLVVVVLLLSNH